MHIRVEKTQCAGPIHFTRFRPLFALAGFRTTGPSSLLFARPFLHTFAGLLQQAGNRSVDAIGPPPISLALRPFAPACRASFAARFSALREQRGERHLVDTKPPARLSRRHALQLIPLSNALITAGWMLAAAGTPQACCAINAATFLDGRHDMVTSLCRRRCKSAVVMRPVHRRCLPQVRLVLGGENPRRLRGADSR